MSDKKKHVLVIAIVVLLIISGVVIAKLKPKPENIQLFAMDTECTISIYNADNSVVSDCKDKIKQLDTNLSAYNQKSYIYKLNLHSPVKVDDITKRIIKRAVDYNKLYSEVDCTCGQLVDLWNINSNKPNIPSDKSISEALKTIGSSNISINDNEVSLENNTKLNFGACAKGFALDEVKPILDKNNINCAIVSFGSSSLLYGKKPDKTDFITAVRNPNDSNDIALTIETSQCFISTSGGYERFFEIDNKKYAHIFDLSTGYPADTDLKSVTVISKSDGMLTDFLSTHIYICGTSEIQKYLSNSNYQIIAIDNSNKIYCSDSIKQKIKIKNNDFNFA